MDRVGRQNGQTTGSRQKRGLGRLGQTHTQKNIKTHTNHPLLTGQTRRRGRPQKSEKKKSSEKSGSGATFELVGTAGLRGRRGVLVSLGTAAEVSCCDAWAWRGSGGVLVVVVRRVPSKLQGLPTVVVVVVVVVKRVGGSRSPWVEVGRGGSRAGGAANPFCCRRGSLPRAGGVVAPVVLVGVALEADAAAGVQEAQRLTVGQRQAEAPVVRRTESEVEDVGGLALAWGRERLNGGQARRETDVWRW